MAQIALAGKAMVHPSGTASAWGKTMAGRDIEVYFKADDILKIVPYLRGNRDSLGHAHWHSENPDKDYPCSSCKERYEAEGSE